MDFNEIVEGAIVYLPVAQPGALLYVGDGHAAQGDGELNGNALETSMDVEFTVDVIASKSLMTPRVESATHLMTVGLGGSLEDALRAATASLAQWLEQDYHLMMWIIRSARGCRADRSRLGAQGRSGVGMAEFLYGSRLPGSDPMRVEQQHRRAMTFDDSSR
jgi:hypothetical protein